jgi:hypothetical protein
LARSASPWAMLGARNHDSSAVRSACATLNPLATTRA